MNELYVNYELTFKASQCYILINCVILRLEVDLSRCYIQVYPIKPMNSYYQEENNDILKKYVTMNDRQMNILGTLVLSNVLGLKN